MPNILANSSLYSPINLASFCFYLTATIFSLKLLWNILLPFAMVVQATNQPDRTSRKGISLTLEVDLALWLVFCITYAWNFRQLGLKAILFSVIWSAIALLVSLWYLFIALTQFWLKPKNQRGGVESRPPGN